MHKFIVKWPAGFINAATSGRKLNEPSTIAGPLISRRDFNLFGLTDRPKRIVDVYVFGKLNWSFCSFEGEISANYSKLSITAKMIYFPLFGSQRWLFTNDSLLRGSDFPRTDLCLMLATAYRIANLHHNMTNMNIIIYFKVIFGQLYQVKDVVFVSRICFRIGVGLPEGSNISLSPQVVPNAALLLNSGTFVELLKHENAWEFSCWSILTILSFMFVQLKSWTSKKEHEDT